ncbi:T9SS type A sorting domain-containing protein [Labilibacter sediminis]|nr:T9SS type A sorting domain-containing protein [Labilibacter sediminis]
MIEKLHRLKNRLIALVALVALIGGSSEAFAQAGTTVDVVYTSNGGVNYSGSYQYDSPKYYWMDAGNGDYVEIKWNSGLMTPAWEFYLYESDGTITIFNTNTAATEMVPQNGWRDDSMSGTDNLATFSGTGTEDNIILSTTTVDVVFSNGTNDLGGEYSYDVTDATGRASYYLDVWSATGGWAIISWNETESRWDFWLDHDTDDVLYATNNSASMLVPQNGWVAEASYDVPLFTGSGVEFDPASTIVIVTGAGFDDGTYNYTGDLNGKPTYKNGDESLGFAWDGSQWVFTYFFEGNIDWVQNTNNSETALVPVIGWVDAGAGYVVSVSGSGTENNVTSTSINVVLDDLGGTGEYFWKEEYNTRPSYAYDNGSGSEFIVRWNGVNKWELILVNNTGTYLLNTAPYDITDVPSYGWVDEAGAGLATMSGEYTIDPIQVIDDFGNGASLIYNGDKNGKPSFRGEVSSGIGTNIYEIEWTGTEWKYILTQGFGDPKDMHTNTNDGEMVPQNGWVDISGWDMLFTFSGYYTYDNTTTGISVDGEDVGISVYPNPATDYVNIELSNNATLTVYSVTGAVVLNKEVFAGLNRVDISSLNSGVYLLSIEVKGKVEVVKLQKL